MGRKTKRCSQKCLRHHFSLKPVHYSAFFSREIEFSFCSENQDGSSKMPIFNVDRKPYTSAFILASQQLKLRTQDDLYRLEHERIKRQNYQEKSQIVLICQTQLIPKPKSKDSYCHVCRDLFDDYQQHIDSINHKKALKSSPFEQDIIKLCQQIQKPQKKPILTSNTQQNQFFSQNNESCSHFYQLMNKQTALEQCQDDINFQNQKDTKQLYEGFALTKSIKSFHSYNTTDDKLEKVAEEELGGSILQHLAQIVQKNELQNCGAHLNIEQTASPLKSRFQKPIILTAGEFKLDY